MRIEGENRDGRDGDHCGLARGWRWDLSHSIVERGHDDCCGCSRGTFNGGPKKACRVGCGLEKQGLRVLRIEVRAGELWSHEEAERRQASVEMMFAV